MLCIKALESLPANLAFVVMLVAGVVLIRQAKAIEEAQACTGAGCFPI